MSLDSPSVMNYQFIVDFIKKTDSVTTDSGLMYRVIEGSDGVPPTTENKVKVHHKISLVDGSIVDDTYAQNQPDEFDIEEAIDGLQEGLQLMPTGARYEFVIPPELAWGKEGNGSKVGPQHYMVMDVKLLSYA